MDEALLRIVRRLIAVRYNLGAEVFEEAVHRALVGIGRAVLEEGERRSRESATKETASAPSDSSIPS